MVQRLVQGSEDCQDNWSMSELMQAIVLLTHFHALASFVFGCGVTSETNHPDGHVYTTAVDEHSDVGSVENDATVNGHATITAEVSHSLISFASLCHLRLFSAVFLLIKSALYYCHSLQKVVNLCCCVSYKKLIAVEDQFITLRASWGILS